MTQRLTPEQAAALLHPTDVLGIPLGPGHPGGFLHALGARTDWEDFTVTGALLTDFYELFGRPGVRFLSGFYGPLERLMRDQGGAIEFVPADFRRFGPLIERIKPRVVATFKLKKPWDRIQIARRTVTKYRKAMNIPSSRQRRDWTEAEK